MINLCEDERFASPWSLPKAGLLFIHTDEYFIKKKIRKLETPWENNGDLQIQINKRSVEQLRRKDNKSGLGSLNLIYLDGLSTLNTLI